ncbi:MAG: TetR/AcrR family transcriptional regulator [Rhodocyclaceae bacterium]|jgi:TetR/AcrR family transcriptional repressor of mexJK operon|nr:TetR/AcrR family transcriptional regulator [Rhodocyclaceae bacterium]
MFLHDVSPSPGDCRARLLQAAAEVFAAEGYRVGVDRIAAHAGVAKQTLYNHFSSKADLFGAVIQLATQELLVTLDDADLSLRERLIGFGTRYREKLLNPTGLGFYRMLVAETLRFPELAASFYRAGPSETAARMCAVLTEAMRRGELRQDDPQLATTLLLSMLVGTERNDCLFSGVAMPMPEPSQAGKIIDYFLRAFAP